MPNRVYSISSNNVFVRQTSSVGNFPSKALSSHPSDRRAGPTQRGGTARGNPLAGEPATELAAAPRTRSSDQARGLGLPDRKPSTPAQHAFHPHSPPRANILRPETQAHPPAEEARLDRGARRDPDSIPAPQAPAERPLRGVRQDKDRLASDLRASRQPASVDAEARSPATSRKSARSPNTPGATRRAVPVQLWVAPLVKAELARVAAQDGLSLSAAGAALLAEALRQNLHIQHAVLLQPIIEQAIARQMRSISTRLAWLLVRVAFDAGQTRSLVTNILGRQPGMTPDLLKTLLAESGKTAKSNITRRTPQITELIEAVEHWIIAEDGARENT